MGLGAIANSAIASPVSSTAKSIPIPVIPATDLTGTCPDLLEPTITSIIERPMFASSRWGILVEAADSNQTLYAHNANEFLIPASNIKLLTTAAALQDLSWRSPHNALSIRGLVRTINLTSNNRYADALLSQIGGPQVVKERLAILGINPNSYRQVDGSGLSRYNMATPSTFVSILKAMSSDEEGNVFYSSLPIAGVSGTLRYRFQNTSVQGQLRAKTGTLRGVRALSGLLNHPDYDVLVFSILVNQPNQSGEVLIEAIDEIVMHLNQLTRCS
jgi:D-alanyl-D-alanine carboxypeptidase/D-alanyl-D-alanine-endopeptidase (penicillin-binding protein 4)